MSIVCFDVEAVSEDHGWTVRLADGTETHVEHMWQVQGAARRLIRAQGHAPDGAFTCHVHMLVPQQRNPR